MRKRLAILTILLLYVVSGSAFAQKYTFSGIITEKSSGNPVEFATVVLEGPELWAVADAEGRFSISGVPAGKTKINVACLGYVSWDKEIEISRNIKDFKITLIEDNLSLESAVVTAQEDANSATTARTIDKTALDHVQVMNVSDISALLPGGATQDPTLTSEKQFNIRGGNAEGGNNSFTTAVEVDGVRLSNNASFTNSSSGSFKGINTNSIASSNIESVEVITGVPSVEYGDMSSGVVKINTRRGRTPLTITMSTSPKTKQVSASKGFSLGHSKSGQSRGVLNGSLEYTRSISEPMSPYTSYDRKQLSLLWSNTYASGRHARTPLRISAGITGNLGGLDNKADPDKLVGTFLKQRDNSIRGNIEANWLLSKPWITNLEFKASAVYGDRLQRERSMYHSAVSSTNLHATEAGYYMSEPYSEGGDNNAVRIDPGIRYNIMCIDDRPLDTKVSLKVNWAINGGIYNNKVKYGAEWAMDKNFGIGEYTEEMSTAPTFRTWRFCDIPAMHNVAGFVEDNFMLHTGGDSRLNLIAGLRWDNTIMPGSAYGITSSLSPRFNFKYTLFTPATRVRNFFKEFSVRASWGVAVKQPSFSVLYPTPSYFDINAFTSTADANNIVSNAYYVMPRTIAYNAELAWQRNQQAEAGIDINLGGTKISLAGFYNRTLLAYTTETFYERFIYTETLPQAVQGLPIPAGDRIYSINPTTGRVTVSDRTGALAPIEAEGIEKKSFISAYTEHNEENPITRYGLEWIIDFARIKALNTTIRLDGSFYNYKAIFSDLTEYCPTTQTSYDKSLYKYVGFYYGDNSNSNGKVTQDIHTNLTITTNIPQVRMIISFKLESSLLKYSRSLSERLDGSRRSLVLADRTDLLSYTDASVYDGECYTVLFPDTYCSFDDPTQKPFLENLEWAKANDPELYADLTKLIVSGTTYNYTFLKDFISPYFSANFSVTKEIGDIASISFYANNFFNNMGQVYSTKTKTYSSVSSFIPRFYYGLTLRLKFN
ncbi:MAG: TonB-dependent receptor [Bacteroidales bacterium]|nr:TonB-dependent receptor [Bacteroidales bacterium]